MKKHLTLEITQKDIDDGIPRDLRRCPVALAGCRMFPRKRVIAGAFSLKVTNTICYTYPYELEEFVWNLDIGNAVQPGVFELTLK
jgi:hypothetical protein